MNAMRAIISGPPCFRNDLAQVEGNGDLERFLYRYKILDKQRKPSSFEHASSNYEARPPVSVGHTFATRPGNVQSTKFIRAIANAWSEGVLGGVTYERAQALQRQKLETC
jgi:hypothetical protein